MSPASERLILSMRATGEGHLSSIVFRTAEIDGQGNISIHTPTRFVTAASPIERCIRKFLFERKLMELGLFNDFTAAVLADLPDSSPLKRWKAVWIASRAVGISSPREAADRPGIRALARAKLRGALDLRHPPFRSGLFSRTPPGESRASRCPLSSRFAKMMAPRPTSPPYLRLRRPDRLPQMITTGNFLNSA